MNGSAVPKAIRSGAVTLDQRTDETRIEHEGCRRADRTSGNRTYHRWPGCRRHGEPWPISSAGRETILRRGTDRRVAWAGRQDAADQRLCRESGVRQQADGEGGERVSTPGDSGPVDLTKMGVSDSAASARNDLKRDRRIAPRRRLDVSVRTRPDARARRAREVLYRIIGRSRAL
jgi:hypothetical protein